MSSTDPFLSVREDVKANLEQANLLLESYERILSTSAPESEEVLQTLEDLDQVLEEIDQDIDDLQDAVNVISGDPSKYNLTQTDVEKRRGFLSNVRSDCLSLKKRAHPPSTQSQADNQPEEDGETQESREQEELYQQQIMDEQDIQLDSVYNTVGNLWMQANTMGQELGEQAEMLEEFENAVDNSANRLKKGMKRIEIFLKKNEDTRSNCCIGLLIAILIILLVLVVLI